MQTFFFIAHRIDESWPSAGNVVDIAKSRPAELSDVKAHRQFLRNTVAVLDARLKRSTAWGKKVPMIKGRLRIALFCLPCTVSWYGLSTTSHPTSQRPKR
jgi:hypothetical protein